MNRLSLRSAILAAFLAVAVTGCFSNEDPQTGPEIGNLAETTVSVRNNNWLDMVIYAVRGNHRQRLGTVNSLTSDRLLIPKNMMSSASSLQLVASPIGSSQTYATHPVDVWPGDTVEFTIENNMGLSNVGTW